MYSDSSSPEVRRLAAELHADKYRYLLNIARRNAASKADAEEATQDAFTYFLADYDPAAGVHPLAWLTTTVNAEPGAFATTRTSIAGSPHRGRPPTKNRARSSRIGPPTHGRSPSGSSSATRRRVGSHS
jgi:Sigma-70 region 2